MLSSQKSRYSGTVSATFSGGDYLLKIQFCKRHTEFQSRLNDYVNTRNICFNKIYINWWSFLSGKILEHHHACSYQWGMSPWRPFLRLLITGVSIVCSTVCSGADQRKHQSSASLAFVRPVTRKVFSFDDAIRKSLKLVWQSGIRRLNV